MNRHLEPHLDPVVIDAYVTRLVDHCAEVTIEQHLLECGQCRMMLARAASAGKLPEIAPERVDAVWSDIVSGIDRLSLPAPTARRPVSMSRTCGRQPSAHDRQAAGRQRHGIRRVVAQTVAALLLIVGMTGLSFVGGIQFTAGLNSTTPTEPTSDPDRTNASGVAAPVQCRIGSTRTCGQGPAPEGSDNLCSPGDVSMSVAWEQAESGLTGALRVANSGVAPCWLPPVPDIWVDDVDGAPFRSLPSVEGTAATAADQPVLLARGRSAVSSLVWNSWCSTVAAPTVRISLWTYPPVDLSANGPASPRCHVDESSGVPVAGKLHLVLPMNRGNTPV